MVSAFRRSLSFSIPLSPRHHKSAAGGHHLRSVSLPCRSHPLISTIEDEIRTLRIWQSNSPHDSLDWISDGLDLISRLHASVHDLLRLPQTLDSFSRQRRRRDGGSTAADRLLDDFLRLADAHGSFRAAAVTLRLRQAETRAAERRQDGPRLAACARAQRRAEKELARLAPAVRCVSKPPAVLAPSDAAEAETFGIVREAVAVTAAASAAVFSGVAGVSAAATSSPAVAGWSVCRAVGPLFGGRFGREKVEGGAAEEERMEEWMVALEERSERVFRGLVNTRVSLLNILTPSFS